MKTKKILAIVLTFALVFGASAALTGCGKRAKLSADMFKGYKVDFSDATAIGISEGKSSGSAKVSANIYNSLASANAQSSATGSGKNKLITVDAENAAREVVFKQIDGDKEIEQDDIKNAEIDKVYATDNFVYFSLTTGRIDRSGTDIKYDQTNYRSNGKYYQSFVVDRATDKVYSLAEIGYITFIENNIVQTDDTFYALSIVGENAVFTDLYPIKIFTRAARISTKTA
ncbi:MAG: hypothetical protein LBL66_08745 [Clostridiales bacterium]|jgi:hypothetical protein|nr:hypothetical protein [Clostridiales bacterium]